MPLFDISSEQFPIQAIRFQVTGDWYLQDFNSLLDDIRFIHDRLFVVMAIGHLVQKERRKNEGLYKTEKSSEMDYFWHSLYFGREYYYRQEFEFPPITIFQNQPFSDVKSAVEIFRSPMLIDAIRMESPGWIQLIGNLSPLKVIADFVTKWRAENTTRKAIESKERLEQQKAANEREKIRSQQLLEAEKIRMDFIRDLMSQLPSHPRINTSKRFVEIAEFATNPVLERLYRITDDPRVLGAIVTAPGKPLPTGTIDPSLA